MKKTAQIILFLVTGVIIMYFAVSIPLAHFYAIDQGSLDICYYDYCLRYWISNETKRILEFYLFIYMFLSINFLILGSILLLDSKIEKIFSIKRIIYIALISYIISWVIIRILMVNLFPGKFALAI